jgi:hypothetical protein
LQTIHAALRPAGLLLDIHPEPRHATVEVQGRNGPVFVGQHDNSAGIAKIHTARAGLDLTIRGGLFARERATTFVFLYSFESVDAWLEHAAERWSETQIPLALIARARALFPSSAGELRVGRRIHAARLRRLSPCISSSS